MRILIFGDSIAQGHSDSSGGWANRAANVCHTRTLKDKDAMFVEVFNLGISGDTVQNIIDRIEDETEVRRSNDKIYIVVAAGINDSLLIENRVAIDEYKFQEQYEKLVKTVTSISDGCLFVGLTAVDENLTNPLAASKTGKQYLNNRINLFEDCIKQVCNEKNVAFVPVHDMFIGQLNGRQSLLADGLHPDNAGHALLFEIIFPEIKTLCGI